MKKAERIYLKESDFGIETQINHIRRYQFVLNCLNKTDSVLDLCCGSGFGCRIMKEKAKTVVGIDKSKKAIDFAKKHYKDCVFKQGDALKISKDFDVITMFECIEHVEKKKAKKILDNVGKHCKKMLFLSTPTDAELGKNIYHKSKWNVRELEKELKKNFSNVIFMAQSWSTGVIHYPHDKDYSIIFVVAIK